MRLRTQMLFLCLLFTLIPWAGCQYIREVDKALTDANANALAATAQAAAARLTRDPDTLSQLALTSKKEHAHYVHRFSSLALRIDGFSDDWPDSALELTPLSAGAAGYSLARSGSDLFFFIVVRVANPVFFDPSRPDRPADRLALSLSGTHLRLAASAPGPAQVFTADDFSALGRPLRGSALLAYWREAPDGYRIEGRVPQFFRSEEQRFDLAFLAANDSGDAPVVGRHLVQKLPKLDQTLAGFTATDTSLTLVNPQGFVLVERAAALPPRTLRHGWLDWAFDRLLNAQREVLAPTGSTVGKTRSPLVRSSEDIKEGRAWVGEQGAVELQVSRPLVSPDDENLGTVIVARHSAYLTGPTRRALDQLLGFSGVWTVTLIAFTLAYAAWLSWRIRQLNRATRDAMDRGAPQLMPFPVSRAGDEIGELNREIHGMLKQIDTYTQYLRSLADKLSHELRTPIAVVKSSLDNLDHSGLTDEARPFLTRAREGSERLSRILNALSSASRLEQSMQEMEFERFDLVEVMNAVVEAYRGVYTDHRFELVLPEMRPLQTTGSPDLLVQALDKLIDNAADFAPSESTITVDVNRHAGDFELLVRNEGPPLPDHMQDQLFDSLISVRDRDTKDHLGLGLYIVRLIAERHQGRPVARNTPSGVELGLIWPEQG